MGNGKWLVVLAVLCLAVALVAVAYAAGKAKAVPVQQVVRAKRFELVDRQGRVRGEFRTEAYDGSPSLRLFGRDGKPCAALAVSGNRGGVWLCDRDGDGSSSLAAAMAFGILLGDTDWGAKRQAFLQPDALRLLDSYHPRVWVGFWQNEGPRVELRDKGGKIRAALGVTGMETIATGDTHKTAESSLVLFDKEGKVLWRVP